MFNNFNLDGCKILKDAEKERESLKHPYVGSEHLLLSLLKNCTEIKDIFLKYEISYNKFRSELIKVIGKSKKILSINLYTPLLKRIIANALEDANETNCGEVLPIHYIMAMLEEAEGIAFRMLISMNVNIEMLQKDLKQSNKAVNSCLKEIGIDLNETICIHENILGRDEQIKQMIEILLRKKKNNPILIGEAGVGKTALVEELARRINLKRVPDVLENKRIIMLEMGSLVAGTKYRGEFEEKLTKIINEVIQDKNIILFIDEIHTIINAGGAEGAINAADILKPYLARGEIKCIGATTPKEYEKTILKDKALARRFEKIIITEPSRDELEDILMGVKREYEDFHNIKVSKKNIKDIIKYSDKYILNKYNPDKSIDLLDTVCAYVKLREHEIVNRHSLKDEFDLIKSSKEKAVLANDFETAIKFKRKEEILRKKICECKTNAYINEDDILKIISDKINMPVKERQLENIMKIKHLLLENIIGQNIAINKLVDKMKDYYQKENEKPLILFLQGPVGVGKGLALDIISKFFEKKYPIVKINLKKINDDSFFSKLIGVNAGYIGYGGDYLLKPLKDNAFAVVCVENYSDGNEKMREFIKNIIEEGKFMNGEGEWISCKNTIFIITNNLSNINDIGFTKNEFINSEDSCSIEETINFNSITEDDLKEYLKRKNISKDKYQKIITNYDYKKFGFSKIGNVINQKIHS